jgi:flagellin-like hook-associated protein FlgL
MDSNPHTGMNMSSTTTRTRHSLTRLLATMSLAAPLAQGCCPQPCCPDDATNDDTGLHEDPDTPEDCTPPRAWMAEVEAGVEVAQRADSGALAIQELLLFIRARALRAASEVTAEAERDNLASEHATLAATIDKLARSTAYEGTILTDGSRGSWDVTFGEEGASQTISIALSDLTTSTLGVDSDVMDLSEASEAQSALDLEDAARHVVEAWRSSLSADHDSLLAAATQLETAWEGCALSCTACEGGASFGQAPVEAEQGVFEALVTNTEEAIGLTQQAAGSAESIHTTLESIRELMVASAAEDVADDERAHMQDSFEVLSSEVDRTADASHYNEIALLDGTTEALDAQVGDANTVNERFAISLADLTASTLGVDTGAVDISSASGAQSAIDCADVALDTVESVQSGLETSALALDTILADLERQLE